MKSPPARACRASATSFESLFRGAAMAVDALMTIASPSPTASAAWPFGAAAGRRRDV